MSDLRDQSVEIDWMDVFETLLAKLKLIKFFNLSDLQRQQVGEIQKYLDRHNVDGSIDIRVPKWLDGVEI